MSLSIKRGAKEFNLTGIQVNLGDGKSSKSFTITPGVAGINMSDGSNISLPDLGAYQTYLISTGFGANASVTNIEVYPIVYPKNLCEAGKSTKTL